MKGSPSNARLVAGTMPWLGLLLVSGCVLGPFPRPVVDNRDPDRVGIRKVHDDSTIDLDDGRTVRLFGVAPPEDPRKVGPYVRALRRFVGREASVTVALADPVPAVDMRLWKSPGLCGTCLSTWNPWARPVRISVGTRSAAAEALAHGGAIFEPDLADPRADPARVRAIRTGDAYDRSRLGHAPR